MRQQQPVALGETLKEDQPAAPNLPCVSEWDSSILSFCQGDIWPLMNKETSLDIASLQKQLLKGLLSGQYMAAKVTSRWHWPPLATSRGLLSVSHPSTDVGLEACRCGEQS